MSNENKESVIKTRHSTDAYRDGWDRIFGGKKESDNDNSELKKIDKEKSHD